MVKSADKWQLQFHGRFSLNRQAETLVSFCHVSEDKKRSKLSMDIYPFLSKGVRGTFSLKETILKITATYEMMRQKVKE